MVHVLDREIKLILVALGVTAIFGTTVGQHTTEPEIMLIVEANTEVAGFV